MQYTPQAASTNGATAATSATQTPSRRLSSLPLSRSSHNPSPAPIRRPAERAISAGTTISSFSPFPKPSNVVPLHAAKNNASLVTPKRGVRSKISIDEFPKPPSTAPKSPDLQSSSSSETTPFSSRQTSDSYGRNSGGKETTSTRSSASQLGPRPSISSMRRGRSPTTIRQPAPSVESPESRANTLELHELEGEEPGNVIISVRVRPETGMAEEREEEEEDISTDDWQVESKTSTISYQGREGGEYIYDNVFAHLDQNSRVYNSSAKRLVQRVMEGFHGTVFAYGMTGSGKTFSMQGTASSPGIIPLAITDIFSFIRESPQREFLLRVSYLEIYNERINDLLSTSTMKPGQKEEEIKLRQDSRRGVYASPLKEEIVQSPTQLLRVIARGDQRRRTSSTQYNLRSSRSHAVVQIVVESRERNAVGAPVNKRNAMLPGGVRISTLSLIDLAGSERAAETKERRTEGGHINKSLLTLGTVISKLSATKDAVDKDHKHIPYRDSKLTRLLQGALSGESLISILCTVQLGNNTIETLNTLKFAARARNNIVSHAKKAKEGFDANDPGSRGLLEMYRTEILQLRKDLEAQKKQSEKMREDEEEKAKEAVAEARHEEHMLEMQLARTALKERIDHLNKLIISSKSAGVNNRKSAYGATPKRLSSSSTIASTYSKRTSRGRQDSDSSLARLDNNSTYSIGRASSMGSEIYDDEGSPIISDEELDADEDKIALQQQVTKLQADMAERDQYIITLEERLNRARKASRSRGRNKSSELLRDTARGWETVVNEKDAEIAELKEKLEDKDRMVVALRNMNKKRDAATSSMATPGQFAISTSAHASGQNTRNATSRSSSLEIVPPLPAGSISELLARRKASGIVSLRPRTSPSPAATNFLDVQGSIPSSTYGTTQPSVMSSPPTTPSSFPSPPTHQGTFFSTRRLSLSSQEGDILPSKVRPSSLSPVISRPNSAGRSHSRNKPHRRSISSAGPIPLQLASVLPSSPTLPKTPPPPPKSEKRVSKQVPSTNGNQQGLSDSSPELGKAQVVIPGTPKQTLKHAGDLVREAIENREAKSPNIVLEEERKTSMRAEFVGEAF